MRKSWKRIESWLRDHAPVVLASLQPGADDAAIQKAERELNIKFPDDVRASFRIHDGQAGELEAPMFIELWHLLSLDSVIQWWRMWKELLDAGEFEGYPVEPGNGVRGNWFHSRWVPLASNQLGDICCLDFDPAEGGRVGQMIKLIRNDPARVVVAADFKAWLDRFAVELHSGLWVYSDEHGGLIEF